MANNLNTTNPPASTVPASGAAVFSPETPPSSQRELLERAIENLIAFLDVIDPDPDLEDGGDAEPDEDGEPSLASTASINQQHWALSSCWRKLAALFRWGRRAASRLLVRRLEIAGTGFDARDEKFRTALG